MEDFSNWIEEMTEEFENDFLGINKSKINKELIENDINEIK